MTECAEELEDTRKEIFRVSKTVMKLRENVLNTNNVNSNDKILV